MWGYLPGVSPQRSPLLRPVPVRLPAAAGDDVWRNVCGGGCGFAMAISDCSAPRSPHQRPASPAPRRPPPLRCCVMHDAFGVRLHAGKQAEISDLFRPIKCNHLFKCDSNLSTVEQLDMALSSDNPAIEEISSSLSQPGECMDFEYEICQIIGAVLIVIGLHFVLWGKSEEKKAKNQDQITQGGDIMAHLLGQDAGAKDQEVISTNLP